MGNVVKIFDGDKARTEPDSISYQGEYGTPYPLKRWRHIQLIILSYCLRQGITNTDHPLQYYKNKLSFQRVY
jgi:hypothetical protein